MYLCVCVWVCFEFRKGIWRDQIALQIVDNIFELINLHSMMAIDG